ncbi:MAG: DUF6538 domain-containing protein [Phyllobacterium sp.]
MVLFMSRPSKHPRTGIYQFRKRVPDTLRLLIGKTEEKVSLRTRDPAAAKVLHAKVLAEVEDRWRLLLAGVQSLSEKQATAIGGEIYRSLIAEHEDNPSRMPLGMLLFDQARHQPNKVRITLLGTDREKTEQLVQKVLDRSHERMRKFVDDFLTDKGLRLDEPSMKMVLARVAEAAIQAREHIWRMGRGDYSPDPKANRFPPFEGPQQPKSKPEQVGSDSKYHLVTVFESYAKEKGIASTTYAQWKPIIEKVATEVPDCRELTKEWVIGWKDKLLAQGLQQKSIRDRYIAALKAVCTWGVANARLSENPCATVTISIPRTVVTRTKSFTTPEATSILAATLRPMSERMTKEMQAAHRWVPWLCAYTGARVGEMSQLRKEDVQEHEGHWLLWITPEAGSTKNGNPRFVALHPHLMEQGFIDFVQGQKAGPLFYDKKLARVQNPKHPHHKKVGEKICKWIRSKEVGVADERVQPNHGWRHTFKTKARGVGMDVSIRDYMQGHVPRTEGEAYGEYPPKALAREIAKLPRFSIG